MDFHTKSYKSPDPEVPIQSLYICINRVTQTVSLGCLCWYQLDGASRSNSVWEVVARFSLFYKQNGAFWFAKSKAINFSSKDYFDRSICNFQRLEQQKNILVRRRSSSKFKSPLQHVAHVGTRFNSKKSIHAIKHHWVKFVQCIGKNTSRKL